MFLSGLTQAYRVEKKDFIICRTDTGLESGKEGLYSQDRQANRVEQNGFTHRTDTG